MSDDLRDAIRARIAAKIREKHSDTSVKARQDARENPLTNMPWDFDDDVAWDTVATVEAPLYNCPGQRITVKAPGWTDQEGPGCGLFLSRRLDTGETCILLASRMEGTGTPAAMWIFANTEREEAKRLLDATAKFGIMNKAFAANPKAERQFVKMMGTH